MSDHDPSPVGELDAAIRELAFRLGLGDLNHRNRCFGYANGCGCSDCSGRAKNVAGGFLCWLEKADEDSAVPRYWRTRGAQRAWRDGLFDPGVVNKAA